MCAAFLNTGYSCYTASFIHRLFGFAVNINVIAGELIGGSHQFVDVRRMQFAVQKSAAADKCARAQTNDAISTKWVSCLFPNRSISVCKSKVQRSEVKSDTMNPEYGIIIAI